MTLETFQAVKLEASKGGLGRAGAVAGATGREQRAGAEAGCRALEDGSGKEGEPKASGAERAGNIDHAASTVNHSKAPRTILDPNFPVYLTGETALSRSFGRSDGNGTSQLLVMPLWSEIVSVSVLAGCSMTSQ